MRRFLTIVGLSTALLAVEAQAECIFTSPETFSGPYGRNNARVGITIPGGVYCYGPKSKLEDDVMSCYAEALRNISCFFRCGELYDEAAKRCMDQGIRRGLQR